MHAQNKNWGHTDNRQRVRFQRDAQVEIHLTDGAVIFGQMRDISLNGLYFYTWQNLEQTVPLHSTVSVRLVLSSGPSTLSIELESLVVRIDRQGVGLRFTHPFQFLSIFTLLLPGNSQASSGANLSVRGSGAARSTVYPAVAPMIS